MFFLAACSSPSAQLEQVKQTLESWSGTIDMVQEQWNKHTIPHAYVKKTLQAAHKELKKQAEQVRSLKVSAGRKQVLIEQIQKLENKSARIMQEADGGNRGRQQE